MSELEVTSVVKSLNNPTLSNPLVNMLNIASNCFPVRSPVIGYTNIFSSLEIRVQDSDLLQEWRLFGK